METNQISELTYAVCINNQDYPASLELHKIYRVIRDQDTDIDGDLRIIDESGEDYLYPASYFMLIELSKEVKEVLLQTSIV